MIIWMMEILLAIVIIPIFVAILISIIGPIFMYVVLAIVLYGLISSIAHLIGIVIPDNCAPEDTSSFIFLFIMGWFIYQVYQGYIEA